QVPQLVDQPRVRIRGALQVDVQLATGVPRHGRDATAPRVHRAHDPAGELSVAGPTAEITLSWKSGLVFTGGGKGRPAVTVDGDSKAGSSPVETLLIAAASPQGVTELSAGAGAAWSHRDFYGVELGAGRRAGQGRVSLVAAGGRLSDGWGGRVDVRGQFVLLPFARAGLGWYGGMGAAW